MLDTHAPLFARQLAGLPSRSVATKEIQRHAARVGLVLLVGLAFGSAIVMMRWGLHELPPLWLVSLRLTVALGGVGIAVGVRQRRLPTGGRAWLDLSIVGISNVGLPLVACSLALQFISSSVLTLVLALIPLLTGLGAHGWVAQERLSRGKLGGLLTALSGVLCLVMTKTTGLPSATAGSAGWGYALAFAGVLAIAFAAVYTRRRLRTVDSLTLAAAQVVVGWLVVLPFALALSPLDLGLISWRGWLAVTYSSLIGSCGAGLLSYCLLQRFGALTSTLPGYVVPVVATLLGALVLDEVISGALLLSASLTLVGAFWASW
jgi:drug/metabolite transporter (DMT)-like permease